MSDFHFEKLREDIFNCNVIDEETVTHLLMKFNDIINHENNVLLLTSPIVICGDIHGQMYDLFKLFEVSHGMDEHHRWNNSKKYLFMGDYVDRGYHSLNTFLLLVSLKVEHPNSIFLLRGNHESRQISHTYGFYNEIVANYGHSGLWTMCNDTFDLLPIAALVDSDIFCVHGGLSPSLPLIERISLIDRQQEIPMEGPFTDICWSDPDQAMKQFQQNTRGAGYLFGKDQCTLFNRINRLRMVCRSHQLAMDGYAKFFGDSERFPDWRLITIWSAPDYTYRSGNLASVMHVNDTEAEFSDSQYHLNVFDKSEERKTPSENELPIMSFYFT